MAIEFGDRPIAKFEELAQRSARMTLNDPGARDFVMGIEGDELESLRNRKKFLIAHPDQITAKSGTVTEECLEMQQTVAKIYDIPTDSMRPVTQRDANIYMEMVRCWREVVQAVRSGIPSDLPNFIEQKVAEIKKFHAEQR